jgi:hypothetical protein
VAFWTARAEPELLVVLAPHQLARRWSARNPSVPIHPYDNSAGLGQRLRLLSDAHTAGGMGDIAFRFSDSPSCVRDELRIATDDII